MLLFAADENFNNEIIRSIFQLNPAISVVRVQDVGLSAHDDPTILEWAAKQNRILLTHDVSTITKHAYDRVRAGKPMPGVFEVAIDARIWPIAEDILVIAECSISREWEGQVRYLPLR